MRREGKGSVKGRVAMRQSEERERMVGRLRTDRKRSAR
jgi:hypothetical protein